MSSPFTAHRDSIVGRLEAQRHQDLLRDLKRSARPRRKAARPKKKGAPEVPRIDLPAAPLRPPGAITSCPLDPSWRLWDMFNTPKYWDVPADTQPVIDAASAAAPAKHLGLVQLDWEMARDDAASVPMTSAESGQPDWKYSEGSPRHLHAEAVIDGTRVHVDWVYARKHGPGRSITEIRIFVDDRLAGRGGRCGCALGFGRGDLPAVALLGDGKALTVNDVTSGALDAKAMPELVAELWLVQTEPPS